MECDHFQKSPGIPNSTLRNQNTITSWLLSPFSRVSKLHHFFGMSKNFPTPHLVSLTQLSLSYVTVPSKLRSSFLLILKQESPFLSQRYRRVILFIQALSDTNLRSKTGLYLHRLKGEKSRFPTGTTIWIRNMHWKFEMWRTKLSITNQSPVLLSPMAMSFGSCLSSVSCMAAAFASQLRWLGYLNACLIGGRSRGGSRTSETQVDWESQPWRRWRKIAGQRT